MRKELIVKVPMAKVTGHTDRNNRFCNSCPGVEVCGYGAVTQPAKSCEAYKNLRMFAGAE